MTVNELVDYIAEELNVSSPDSKARIGRELNVRYKQVTSAIGLPMTRRAELNKAATIGDRHLTFTGAEKLEYVYRKVGTKNFVLDELTHDEMVNVSPQDEPPTKFSIYSVTPNSVTIWMDCTPTTPFTLYASGLTDASTLTNLDRPNLPESFHDVLIYGVLADEYRRMQKPEFFKETLVTFDQRLSDLRLFMAKSAMVTVYRGKTAPAEDWWDTGNAIRRT